MSDHLLECPSSNTCECNMGPVHKDSCPQRKKCICTELRACEQRVLDERAWKIAPAIEQYAAGVQAARDAVAAAPWDAENWIAHAQRAADLAAIDNLITKNSGENYE